MLLLFQGGSCRRWRPIIGVDEAHSGLVPNREPGAIGVPEALAALDTFVDEPTFNPHGEVLLEHLSVVVDPLEPAVEFRVPPYAGVEHPEPFLLVVENVHAQVLAGRTVAPDI